jgi:hypothetical protein
MWTPGTRDATLASECLMRGLLSSPHLSSRRLAPKKEPSTEPSTEPSPPTMIVASSSVGYADLRLPREGRGRAFVGKCPRALPQGHLLPDGRIRVDEGAGAEALRVDHHLLAGLFDIIGPPLVLESPAGSGVTDPSRASCSGDTCTVKAPCRGPPNRLPAQCDILHIGPPQRPKSD